MTGERLQTTRRGAAPQAERYDRGQSTATLSAAGQVVVARQPGASVNEWTIIAETAPEAGGRTVMRYVLADAQGTVTAALDDQGELVQQASFDPWGMPVGHVGESAPDAVVLPGYRGYAYEPLTRLYDLPARWYDPAVGRFISPAPPADPYSASALNPYVFGMKTRCASALDVTWQGLTPDLCGRQAAVAHGERVPGCSNILLLVLADASRVQGGWGPAGCNTMRLFRAWQSRWRCPRRRFRRRRRFS